MSTSPAKAIPRGLCNLDSLWITVRPSSFNFLVKVERLLKLTNLKIDMLETAESKLGKWDNLVLIIAKFG